MHKIQWARPVLFGDEKRELLKALESTQISAGPYIDKVEAEFAERHGRFALCVSSGTTAIYLAYLALGLKAGDEVIMPGWCFGAVANMAIACGAKPVFADVKADTWLVDPIQIERRITNKTKAIVVVHTYGNVCEMDAITKIARAHGVWLIEDCAEALFSKLNGKLCGTFSDVSCFSFQATKTITSGEGGLVLVKQAKLYEKMKLLRSHGMTPDRKYWHTLVGHNFRLTNLQAALLYSQLGHAAWLIAMRKRVYDRYLDKLSNFKTRLQVFEKKVEPVVWAVGIRVRNRDKLQQQLKKQGIETRPGFYAFSQQPIYKTPNLGNAEKIAGEVICLPAPPDLTDGEIDWVCEKFFKSGKKLEAFSE